MESEAVRRSVRIVRTTTRWLSRYYDDLTAVQQKVAEGRFDELHALLFARTLPGLENRLFRFRSAFRTIDNLLESNRLFEALDQDLRELQTADMGELMMAELDKVWRQISENPTQSSGLVERMKSLARASAEGVRYASARNTSSRSGA
jgi:hypothetical protein